MTECYAQVKKRKPVIGSRNIHLAENKKMHVAIDSSGTLEIRWHRHCNKAILCFVKHCGTRIVAAIFN